MEKKKLDSTSQVTEFGKGLWVWSRLPVLPWQAPPTLRLRTAPTHTSLQQIRGGARGRRWRERPMVWWINQNFSNPVHYSSERGEAPLRDTTETQAGMSLALHQSGLNFFFLFSFFHHMHILWNILLVLLLSTWIWPSGVGAGWFPRHIFQLLIAAWVLVTRKMQQSHRGNRLDVAEELSPSPLSSLSSSLLQVWVECHHNLSYWARHKLGVGWNAYIHYYYFFFYILGF